MKNMTYTLKGTVLTIVVDLSKEGTLSSTGKTMILASSEGNIPITSDIKVGVNCFKGLPK